MKHPYRISEAEKRQGEFVDFEGLDRHVRDIRRALVTGAFEGARRWQLADVVTHLEEIHAAASRQIAVSSAVCTLMAGVMFAMSAWTRTLAGWWGFAISAALIAFAVLLGVLGVAFAGQQKVLDRLRDAVGDLTRYAMTLPADSVPQGVRVAAEQILAGSAPEEVPSSEGEGKERSR